MMLANVRPGTAVAAVAAPDVDGRGPLFIGGLAHSGKTPLRLALMQGDIALSRRAKMWARHHGRYGDLALPRNFDRCLAAMLAQPAIRELCDDAALVRERFGQGAPTYGRLFAIFHEEYARQMGKRRWGEQMGFVERYADAIFAAYPSARMIHMVRDPRDSQAIARERARFRPGKVGWSAAAWRASARLARRNEARYADRYRVVRYEALAAQPEETLRTVCEFVGEPFREEMVAVALASAGSKTADRMPGRGHSAGVREIPAGRRWTDGAAAFIEMVVREEMAYFGYLPLANPPLASLSLVNRAAMWLWPRFNRGNWE